MGGGHDVKSFAIGAGLEHIVVKRVNVVKKYVVIKEKSKQYDIHVHVS